MIAVCQVSMGANLILQREDKKGSDNSEKAEGKTQRIY